MNAARVLHRPLRYVKVVGDLVVCVVSGREGYRLAGAVYDMRVRSGINFITS